MRKLGDPLTCRIEGKHLVIRIGLDRLSYCAKKKNGGPIPSNIKIVDRVQFGKDVCCELDHEDEIGNTPLNILLDKAMLSAVESGSAGVEFKQKKKG